MWGWDRYRWERFSSCTHCFEVEASSCKMYKHCESQLINQNYVIRIKNIPNSQLELNEQTVLAERSMTPSVHVFLDCLHAPDSHHSIPPANVYTPRINFLWLQHNEGRTHKNQMTLSKNTSAAKPNKATCLFTFPAVAICWRINRLRLRWTVRIQSISRCPHIDTIFPSVSLSHTYASPEIAF